MLIVLGFVVFNAGALLLLMVAAFPWDDMLGFPTETISMIKLLGALLLVGYFLRSLARDEDVRLPPTLPSLVIFTMLVLLSLMASGDVASGLSKTLRYLLFAAFSFLVVQLIRSRAAAGRAAARARGLLDGGGALRRGAADQGRRRPRLRPDRRGQRLRVPARLRAAVRGLPDAARPALADVVGDLLAAC